MMNLIILGNGLLVAMVLLVLCLYELRHHRKAMMRLKNKQIQSTNLVRKLGDKLELISNNIAAIEARQLENHQIIEKQSQESILQQYEKAKKVLGSRSKPNLSKLANSDMTEEELELLADLMHPSTEPV